MAEYRKGRDAHPWSLAAKTVVHSQHEPTEVTYLLCDLLAFFHLVNEVLNNPKLIPWQAFSGLWKAVSRESQIQMVEVVLNLQSVHTGSPKKIKLFFHILKKFTDFIIHSTKHH